MKVVQFCVKTIIILAITIDLWLIRYGVHPHPGPTHNNINFLTYNCRGMREKNKMKRLLRKLSSQVEKNCIIALQETHNIDEKLFEMCWKYSHIRNCTMSNKRGVILLFHNEFKVNNFVLDKDERFIIADLQNANTNIIVANVYYPNAVKEALEFSESFYLQLMNFQHNNPSAMSVIMGDMNVCFNKSDYLNRQVRVGESDLAKAITMNNETCEVSDAYRLRHKVGGYTWNRGLCFSRLDYIFVSNVWLNDVEKVEIDWELDKSDHAALKCSVRLNLNIEKGRGIVGINAALLDHEDSAKEINKELKLLLDQIPSSWDPHTKLEFMKVAVRSAFSNVSKEVNKNRRSEVEILENQINSLVNQKITKVEQLKGVNDDNIDKIDLAIIELKVELENIRKKHEIDLAFKAGVKWYEEGEKSNKYFLGMMKVRERQKLITSINEEGKIHSTTNSVMKCIRNFYEQLYAKAEKVLRSDNENDDNSFFNLCPKLSEDRRKQLDKNLTIEELRNTLGGMKDSAPGPDGIPYSVYKKLWVTLGVYVIDAWNFSVSSGKLPPSYSESALTLLPKAGKNLDEVKNWRPITLTNCDQKIITKALANRMAKHLESIIDPAQTAYVPGRSIMDNLRSNLFVKNYCDKEKIDGLLVSLDSKKAFDSVSHNYIRKVLKAYGIGDTFVSFFNVLYKDLTVKILVNGYFSDNIKVERGVKQGDALSCSLFILCMDPLIRNINANPDIEAIKMISKITNTKVGLKCSGYADDIAIICKNNRKSIRGIFKEYERLTKISGLELNADKTEVLRLGPNKYEKLEISFNYCGKQYLIVSTSKVKICGIMFCNNIGEEYEINILEKIERFENQLKKWMCRNLTMEGKILIVKTFGLSQLIYNLQCYQINNKDLVMVEKLIFRFIWSKKWNTNRVGERIKRAVLKNEYVKGGLCAPDIECMNKALKLKQFIRADNSNHCINGVQKFVLESLGYDSVIKQEYSNICKDDEIIKCCQETINIMTDYARGEGYGREENGQSSKIAIEEVGSIYIPEFLKRKKKLLEGCVFNALKAEGIENLSDLTEEIETSNNVKMKSTLSFIESAFPTNLIDIARNFNKDINEDQSKVSHFYLGNDFFVPINEVTVKQLQSRLKLALGKTSEVDYDQKIGVDHVDTTDILAIRKQVRNVKLRNVYYRLINKDFFNGVKMKKYKMIESDNCERCQQSETIEHLMWECKWSRIAWENFNVIMLEKGERESTVNSYKDIYNFNNNAAVNTIKLKNYQRVHSN